MQIPSPVLTEGSRSDIPIIPPHNINPLESKDGTQSHTHENKDGETEVEHDNSEVPDKDNMNDRGKGKVEAFASERTRAP